MLKAGAVIIRTEEELVLKSRWVIPERLVQAEYPFKFRNFEKGPNRGNRLIGLISR